MEGVGGLKDMRVGEKGFVSEVEEQNKALVRRFLEAVQKVIQTRCTNCCPQTSSTTACYPDKSPGVMATSRRSPRITPPSPPYAST